MKLLTALLSIFRPSNDDTVLDHVPVDPRGNVAASRLARARKRAAVRHGKTFRCDVVKPRETEPSPTLKALHEITTPTPVIVLSTPRLVSKQ